MRFGKLQALEARALNGGSRLFRRGVDGSGVSELKSETVSQIRDATKEVMARANESLARQRAKDRPGAIPPSNSSSVPAGSFSARGETAPASNAR